MPRKPIELPAEVAKAFVADMRAFHAEESPHSQDSPWACLSFLAFIFDCQAACGAWRARQIVASPHS